MSASIRPQASSCRTGRSAHRTRRGCARERWDALTQEQRRKLVPLCPDFVGELRSPSDDLTELQAKMDEYIVCGVRLGWLIDVEAKRAWVYRPGRTTELVEGGQRLSADPELPGLVLDLSVLQ